jgi:hypothetical protein
MLNVVTVANDQCSLVGLEHINLLTICAQKYSNMIDFYVITTVYLRNCSTPSYDSRSGYNTYWTVMRKHLAYSRLYV